MKTNSINKTTGGTAILSAVLFFISIYGMLTYLQGDLRFVSSFISNMEKHRTEMLLYGWPGLFATLLMIPLFRAMHRRNNSHKELSGLLLFVSYIGISFVLVGYMFHLAFTYFHAPIYQTLDAGQQLAFDPVFQTNIGLQDMFWLIGDLLAFSGISGIVLLHWKQGSTPKWMMLWVAIAGITAAIGSFSFLPEYKSNMILGLMFMAGFAVYAIWQIAIGISLLRKTHNQQ